MHAVRDRFALRMAALVTAALLSVGGAAACGGSDDDGDGGGAPASAADGGSEEQLVRANLAEVSRAMQARDYAAVCEAATPAIRKQATKWEGYDTCAEGMADAMTDDPTGKANVVDSELPQIESVEIEGDTAVVSAKRGQEQLVARVRKVGDTWLMERWFAGD